MVSALGRVSPVKAPSRSRRVSEIPLVKPIVEPQPQEVGTGKFADPIRLALASSPNSTGCYHCNVDECCCNFFDDVLAMVYSSLAVKRVTEVAGARQLCAKSLLPQFVSRMVRLMNITAQDTFYDLGCGNGSILFQVAYMTGARCVGVELSTHNAEIAKNSWSVLKPILERQSGRKMPQVDIIAGDLTALIGDDAFVADGKKAILTSNLLFPKALTHYMSERFRKLPVGARIMCFDDLYPHSRSVAAIRDPEAFSKFRMMDYVWQEMSVEWTNAPGSFYIHTRV